MYRKISFLFQVIAAAILFPLSLSAMRAGKASPNFRHFSIEEGFPSSETYFVQQDREGYIWICTDRGVVRYDGYRFRIYTKKDGLMDDVVFKTYQDPSGKLWFVTYNGLLSYWDGKRIRPYQYNHHISKYLKNRVTTYKSLVVDRKGNLYYSAQQLEMICISAGGVVSYPKEWNKRTREGHQIIRIDDQWGYMASKSDGKYPSAYLIEGRRKTFLGEFGAADRFSLYAANKKAVFVQWNTQVVSVFNPKAREDFKNLIYLGGDGEYIWFGTTNGVKRKPIRYFGNQRYGTDTYLEGYSVTSVARDSEGGYWFTTLEDGVFYAPGLAVGMYHDGNQSPHLLNCVDVNGYKSNVILGYANAYIDLNSNWTVTDMITYCRRSVFMGEQLFISHGYDTLIPLKGKKGYQASWFKDFFVDSPHSFVFIKTSIGRIHDNGKIEYIYDFTKDKGKYVQRYLETIAIDDKGRLLVGSIHGLFELKNGSLTLKNLEDDLFRTRVTDLDYHPHWGTVVATRGRGVYFMNDYKVTRQLTNESIGLLDNNVNRVYIDPYQNLWICSNKGLNRIKKHSNGRLEVTQMTIAHGLPSNEVNAIYAYGDTIWIATKKGIVTAPADYLNNNIVLGQLKLELIETDRESFSRFRKRLTIGANREYIKVILRTTNFRTGTNRLIRYRYESDGKWLTTSTGELLLSKPNGGDYSLEVSYRNENGVWSPPEVIARFSVLQPFYATWYFILTMVMLGLFLILVAFRLRIRQVKRKHALQKTINELEHKALRAQMNPHFIFNSLNSIQSFLIYEENEKAERFLLKFAHLIRQTLNNSREPYISIESEIETLKSYLELEQMRFKEKFEVELTCLLNSQEMTYGVPPMLIQPFVENAVLHGFKSLDSGGKITVVFESIKDQQLYCIVKDNGIGRKASLKLQQSTHKSYGTKITEERLTAFQQKYGDHFRIETIDLEEDGKALGTMVLLKIPIVIAPATHHFPH
ncbi:MAG TPA: histidine kinase [Fluviicola sp.]|nr:histidine kinase [Fluviicola sp.]